MKIIRYVLIFSAHQGKAYQILYVYPHFTFKKISSFYRSRQHFDFVQWRYLTCLCQIWICNGSQGWQIGQEFQFVWSAIQLSPQHSWDAKALLIRKAISEIALLLFYFGLFWGWFYKNLCVIFLSVLCFLSCEKAWRWSKFSMDLAKIWPFFRLTQSRIVIFLFLFGKY